MQKFLFSTGISPFETFQTEGDINYVKIPELKTLKEARKICKDKGGHIAMPMVGDFCNIFKIVK